LATSQMGVNVTASSSAIARREQLFSLALRYRLPTVYTFRYFVVGGGLAAYGPDLIAIYALSAEYVDRILKGAKPADLPVHAPTKYWLVTNPKAAKSIGLSVSAGLLARADEVID
jgi:putative ABC transport system substrate-binding protein